MGMSELPETYAWRCRLNDSSRLCCDGEEETVGHSIVEFLERDTRGADVAIIFDIDMIRRDVPAFSIATRPRRRCLSEVCVCCLY